jgi:outer membrane protein assembly factor BamB
MREDVDFKGAPWRSVLTKLPSAQVFWDVEPVVCGLRKLTAVNLQTGEPIAVPISATPAIVSGVGVVVASDDGYIRMCSQKLDQVFWERRLNSSIYASLLIDDKHQRVVVASTLGLVVALDLRGNLAWSADLGAPVFATPTLLQGDNLLIVSTFDSCCFGLRLSSGEIAFKLKLPRPWHAKTESLSAFRDPYASPVATLDGRVIIGCAEHLLCIDASGTEVWRYEGTSSIKASPVVCRERILICCVDGNCVFLEASTGKTYSTISLGAKVIASPAVSGEIVAVGTTDGRVFGLDVAVGKLMWSTSDGGPRSYTSLSILPNGHFIAVNARGNVHCLKATDGQFVWESSQVLGLVDHDPIIDIMPVVCSTGSMYACSYAGYVYFYRFQTE